MACKNSTQNHKTVQNDRAQTPPGAHTKRRRPTWFGKMWLGTQQNVQPWEPKLRSVPSLPNRDSLKSSSSQHDLKNAQSGGASTHQNHRHTCTCTKAWSDFLPQYMHITIKVHQHDCNQRLKRSERAPQYTATQTNQMTVVVLVVALFWLHRITSSSRFLLSTSALLPTHIHYIINNRH